MGGRVRMTRGESCGDRVPDTEDVSGSAEDKRSENASWAANRKDPKSLFPERK